MVANTTTVVSWSYVTTLLLVEIVSLSKAVGEPEGGFTRHFSGEYSIVLLSRFVYLSYDFH